ncbi:MAG: Uma2 family endonuclease [Gemmataceae bacterium]|nr:Uma2 family endonuclease [Gemmata sp.]MDW8198306.1 Uma2 family endonuclease [Gemmataceae bacterium]
MNTTAITTDTIVYPESDGQPMADNTLQWDWMVKIVGELRELFAGQEVFVAGDLFWYPVEGNPNIVQAPDVMVVFGRPPGYRGSYKQWEEGGIAPQVVFEILSPRNTRDEMANKLKFYQRYGVEEYYLIDPYKNTAMGWVRSNGEYVHVYPIDGYISPRLGIRFEESGGELKLYTPEGREFVTREKRVEEIQEELRKTQLAFEEERQRALHAMQQIEAERQRAEAEHQRAEAERQRAEAERAAKEALAAKLRELGLDPDSLLKPAS